MVQVPHNPAILVFVPNSRWGQTGTCAAFRQKITFNAKVMVRGPLTSPLIWPKFEHVVGSLFVRQSTEGGVAAGKPKFVRFMALKASARNWRTVFSFTGVRKEKFFNAERSTSWYPGTEDRLRPQFPKVFSAGLENALQFHQFASVGCEFLML